MSKYRCKDCGKVGTKPGELIETEWCWYCAACAEAHGVCETQAYDRNDAAWDYVDDHIYPDLTEL